MDNFAVNTEGPVGAPGGEPPARLTRTLVSSQREVYVRRLIFSKRRFACDGDDLTATAVALDLQDILEFNGAIFAAPTFFRRPTKAALIASSPWTQKQAHAQEYNDGKCRTRLCKIS